MLNRNQNIFFTGTVEDRNDPEKIGRVRVRVHGLHTFDKILLPTNDLPWAITIQNITSAGISGIGHSPTGIVEGSTVFVVFIDGEDYQIPIVLGTIAGIPTEKPNTQLGFYDPNGVYPTESYLNKSDVPKVARNNEDDLPEEVQDDIDSQEKDLYAGLKATWNEPENGYGAEYPKNHVWKTESGHLQEFDDTPGKERIQTRHRTGTKQEFLSDGSLINKIQKNNYEIVYGDEFVYIKGQCAITTEGNMQILCKSSAEIVVDGNLNVKVNGNYQESIEGTCVKTVKGNLILHSDGEIILDAKQIHANTEGKIVPNDLCPALQITALDEATQKDDPETDTSPMPAGQFQSLQERSGTSYTGQEVAKDITPPATPSEEELPKSCDDIPVDWDYTTRLSSRYSVGSLSKNAVFPHNIQAQNGLSVREILCNLKGLVENIIEPIANECGSDKIQINSGFRVGSGSQHNLGQAVDLQFRGFTVDEYIDVAKWCRDNLHFDQLILEYGKNPWLHISYSYDRKRKQILTRTFPGVYKGGLIKIA